MSQTHGHVPLLSACVCTAAAVWTAGNQLDSSWLQNCHYPSGGVNNHHDITIDPFARLIVPDQFLKFDGIQCHLSWRKT